MGIFSIPMTISGLLLWALSLAFPVFGQVQTSDWRKEVRDYSSAHEWESALRVLDRELARAPQDLDIWAWQARVFAWSGQLVRAEKKYVQILVVSQNDPDIWEGL